MIMILKKDYSNFLKIKIIVKLENVHHIKKIIRQIVHSFYVQSFSNHKGNRNNYTVNECVCKYYVIYN